MLDSKDECYKLPLEMDENLPARNQLARGLSRGPGSKPQIATRASAPSRVPTAGYSLLEVAGESMLLALMMEPALLLFWPVLMHGWFLRSAGVAPADSDLFDDD